MSEVDQPTYPTDFILDMTIRQQAVLMAMQGLLAQAEQPATHIQLANQAVWIADACLKAERETR